MSSIPSMQGKTCLVTGSNSGIGKYTALALAKAGAEVILCCRNPDKGKAALEEIREATGNQRLSLLLGDLGSRRDIERMAQEFKAKHSQLHVLVNNAGLVSRKRKETEDGLEMTFGVNHIGPFYLTWHLLELLKDTAPSRIVNVASEAHRFGRMRFDDLQSKQKYRTMQVYGMSKTCNILFTRILAQKLEGSGVTVNSLHPGAVSTNLGKSEGPGWLFKLLSLFFLTPQQGAETSIYLATSPAVEGVSGEYFDKKKPRKLARHAQSQEDAARLWKISEEICGISW